MASWRTGVAVAQSSFHHLRCHSPRRRGSSTPGLIDSTTTVSEYWIARSNRAMTPQLWQARALIPCEAQMPFELMPPHRQILQAAERPAADPHRLVIGDLELFGTGEHRRQRDVGDHRTRG